MNTADVERLLELYPKIFLACHLEHVRDPKTDTVLSAHQASILDHLDKIEPTSVNDLAKHMGVTPSTMSIHIDRLVHRGFVVRREHANDGRRVNLHLTKDGVRIKGTQKVLDPELVRSMLSRLSKEDRETGLRGLALLARAAQELLHRKSEQRAWSRKAAKIGEQENET